MITKENIFTGFEVTCDVCGQVVRVEPQNNTERDTVKSVTKHMRSIMWTIGSGGNKCPKCSRWYMPPKSDKQE